VNNKENHIRNLDRIIFDIKGSKLWTLFNLTRKLEKSLQIIINHGPLDLLKKVVNKINTKLNKEEPVYSDEEQYSFWLEKNRLSAGDLSQMKAELKSFKYKPTISIIMPVFNIDRTWLQSAIDSVLNQIYPYWELCIADDGSTKDHVREVLNGYANGDPRVKVKYLSENKGISLASNEAISMATGEFIALLDHDDELEVNAIYEIVKLIQEHPEADMIYTDEDKINAEGGRCNPFFKPGWSPDLFLAQMYTCHLGVYRKEIIMDIGGFRKGLDGSQDYDLVLRFTEKTDKIFHIPNVLYHWRIIPGSTAAKYSAKSSDTASLKALSDALDRRKIKGSVEKGIHDSLFRVKREIANKPRVSIIMPTKDKLPILKGCIESIMNKTDYENYEIVIVNNNSVQKSTLEYLNSVTNNDMIKVLNYSRPFNYAALNNYAMSRIDADVAVFLNNDTEVISSEWLSAMLEHAQRSEVGAVGAKLVFVDSSIQHAGVILGIGSIAGHAFKGLRSDINQSYFGHADAIRNYSAVTAACMMIRKKIFEEVGGFDEVNLPVAFNDIDLCLRLREKGYLIVYTPYAELFHYESASRGYGVGPDPEADYMLKKWKDKLDNDPYYNINLTLQREDFSIKMEA